MPSTYVDYFENTTQSTPVGDESVWVDPEGANQAAGTAVTSHAIGQGELNTPFLVYTNPKVAGQVPNYADITDITVAIIADFHYPIPQYQPFTNCVLQLLSIAGGLEIPVGELEQDQILQFFISGDLAFWGITDAQALGLARGTEAMQFNGVFGRPPDYNQDINIYQVKVGFTYSDTSVPSPVMF
jgi:hypothetical protein